MSPELTDFDLVASSARNGTLRGSLQGRGFHTLSPGPPSGPGDVCFIAGTAPTV